MIFGQNKNKEDPRKELPEQTKISKKNESNTFTNSEINRNENFLDYDVNTNTQANKKNNFFDDDDMEDEMLNKSQNFSNLPVTGENARAKSPNNEQTNQFFKPESGATTSIEKNNKKHFFKENDEDSNKNTFNLFNDNKSQSTQKVNKPLLTNKIVNVPNQNKSNIEKKNDKPTPAPNRNNRPTVNLQQKNDVLFFINLEL